MSQTKYKQVNISAPNLMNICVDGLENEDIQGRLYHYYGEEPEQFESFLQLIRMMEQFYDKLAFPQASTESRSFFDKKKKAYACQEKKEKQVSADYLISQTGNHSTFVVNVKFRQFATWQGEFFWKEREEKVFFLSTLEFMHRLDQAVHDN